MDERDRLLARYMVGRYRLGYEKLALYLAGVLFEIIVEHKLREIQKIPDYKLKPLKLSQRIEKLKMISFQNDPLYMLRDVFRCFIESVNGVGILNNFSFGSDNKENLLQLKRRLHNFRWIRNQVMHGTIDDMPEEYDNKKEDMINYVWAELAPDSFAMAYRHWDKAKGIIGSMKEHSADYMVRAIDEIDILPKDRAVAYVHEKPIELVESDFENLYALRSKLVPLKNFLADWLKENAPFLITDILTTIDTTSAYVWMPLTKEDPETRRGILTCSVSILATPFDFRVYIDFGGQAYIQREIYYDFLENSMEYKVFAEKYHDSHELEVFDIDWYSHIFNRRSFRSWIENKGDIDAARKKLQDYDKKNGDPLTWNRNLHGYILEKQQITFEMIEAKLRNIIELYEQFKLFAEKKGIQI